MGWLCEIEDSYKEISKDLGYIWLDRNTCGVGRVVVMAWGVLSIAQNQI